MKVTPKQYARFILEVSEIKDKKEQERLLGKIASAIKRNRDGGKFKEIERVYRKLLKEKQGIMEAEVISLKKLEKEQIENVRKSLAQRYKTKDENIVIENTVDENLRGGVIIKIENDIIDASVDAKLNKLRKSLVY